jgi:hypothetical protein
MHSLPLTEQLLTAIYLEKKEGEKKTKQERRRKQVRKKKKERKNAAKQKSKHEILSRHSGCSTLRANIPLDAEALPKRASPRPCFAHQAVEHVFGHGPARQCSKDLAAVLCVGCTVRRHCLAVSDAEMCRLSQANT